MISAKRLSVVIALKTRKRTKGLPRHIEQEQNNWRAFEQLKTHLGQTTFRTRIRNILNPSSSIEPPPIYEKIWRLRPHGVLTLNIDRLATKAYQYAGANKTLLTEV